MSSPKRRIETDVCECRAGEIWEDLSDIEVRMQVMKMYAAARDQLLDARGSADHEQVDERLRSDSGQR